MNPSSYSAFDLGPWPRSATRDQAPERAVGLRRVRHQRQLVGGVEADEVTLVPPAGKKRPQPLVGEHPFHEVVAQARIGQTSLLLDRQARQTGHQRFGEEAAPSSLHIALAWYTLTRSMPQLGESFLST